MKSFAIHSPVSTRTERRALTGPGVALLALLAVLWAFDGVQASPSVSFQTAPVADDDLVRLGIEFDGNQWQPGEAVTGTVIVQIAERWHVNSNLPLTDFSIPTRVTIRSAALDQIELQFPPHLERPFDFAGGETLAVYEGTIRVPFRATRTETVEDDVEVEVYYQACDDRICLPPRTAALITSLGSRTGIAGGEGVGSDAFADASGFTPLSEAPPDGGVRGGLFGGDLAETFASRGLPLTLLVVFLLGLALNLTPCVYPLIPITIGYFSSQTSGSRASRVALSSVYVLGIAVTYSVLGVSSALSGRLFGAWLQSSAVLVFFALLMLALSASMFGLYDIRVPQVVMRRSSARAGFAGALVMGLLAGIVAAPCVGPFVISLIALVAQSRSVPLGLLLFFFLALGLGVPYLFLGIFSSALPSMPRSGAWMVQIKKAFGFILIAMAFYFLRPVVGDEIYRWGVALSLLVGAAFLFFGRGGSRGGTAVRLAAGILFLVVGAAFAIPSRQGPGIDWQPYDAALLETAAATGQPVVIDFYADWCLPCKELDDKTFSDGAVVAESERFVRLKADLTRPEDPETRRLTERFDILGVPTIVFLDPQGRERTDQRLVGFEPPARFVERMRAIP